MVSFATQLFHTSKGENQNIKFQKYLNMRNM